MKRLVPLIAVALLPLSVHAYYPEWVQKGISSILDIRSLGGGDFNGDGRPDVLVRAGTQSLYLLPTDSAAKPGTAALVFTGEYLSDVATGDFDGDRHVDALAADIATNSLMLLRSRNDGIFDAPVRTQLTFAPSQIAAGDFDGDGKLDVAVRSASATILVVLRGDGAGHFAEVSRTALSQSAYTIAVGDIDGDHRLDIVIGRALGLDLYFGKANGTFGAPESLTSAGPSTRIVLADLDADGDAEIVSCEFDPNTLTVIVNLGSHRFAAPTIYITGPSRYTSPFDLIVADVNGDGMADVVVSLTNLNFIATFAGNGNGSLRTPDYVVARYFGGSGSFFPSYLIAGDYDGDGRVDVAVSSSGFHRVAIYANATGKTAINLTSRYPVASAGQPISFGLSITPAVGHEPSYTTPAPVPQGSVVLKEGTTTLATAELQYGMGQITVPSLAEGTHALTVSYGGDDSYLPALSSALEQKVIGEKTATTLSLREPADLRYAQGFMLVANVQTTIAGKADGLFWTFIDGVRSEYTQSGPPLNWSVNYLTAGTHSFYVQYEGNATQPPNTSNVLTLNIQKSQTIVNLSYPVPIGKPMEMRVELRGSPFGGTPGGWITIYEGSNAIRRVFADNRCCSGAITVTTNLEFAQGGVHVIHAVYEGDLNFEPSNSKDVQLLLPAGPPRRRSASH